MYMIKSSIIYMVVECEVRRLVMLTAALEAELHTVSLKALKIWANNQFFQCARLCQDFLDFT